MKDRGGKPMSIIRQTNRTLLFEEINPEKPDLLTLVGDVRGIDSLSDEKIKAMNEALLVRNFDEFITKFELSLLNAPHSREPFSIFLTENVNGQD